MNKLHYCYATVKARGLVEKTYTLTMHKTPVRVGGVEKDMKYSGSFKTGLDISDFKCGWKSELSRLTESKKEYAEPNGLVAHLEYCDTSLLTGDAFEYRDRRFIDMDSFSLNRLPKLADCREYFRSFSDGAPEEMTEDEKTSKRFDSSISRSRSVIAQLAANNPWNYFVTFTFDMNREGLTLDLKSLPDVKKKVLKFFQNYSFRHGKKFKYLLVPQFHDGGGAADGNVHFHGLVSGIDEKDLVKNKHGYLDFVPYCEKFGFCNMDEVEDLNRVSSYITRYISRDMFNGDFEPGTHLYFASKGLKKDELICKGSYNKPIEKFMQSGYECFDYAYCYKVKSDDVAALKSAITPFVGFVDGINQNWPSPKTIFNEYIKKVK